MNFENHYGTGPYPTLLFLDKNGTVVHRQIGAITVNELLDAGKTATQFYNLFGSIDLIKKHIRSGDYRPNEINAFSTYLISNRPTMMVEDSGQMQTNLGIIKNYLRTQPAEALSSFDNMSIIFHIGEFLDIDSREYRFMLTNRNLFHEKFNPALVDNKLLILPFRTNLLHFKKELVLSILKQAADISIQTGLTFISYTRFPRYGEKVSIGYDVVPGIPSIYLTYYKRINDSVSYNKAAEEVCRASRLSMAETSKLVWELHNDAIANKTVYSQFGRVLSKLDPLEPIYPLQASAYAVCLFHTGKQSESKKLLEQLLNNMLTLIGNQNWQSLY